MYNERKEGDRKKGLYCSRRKVHQLGMEWKQCKGGGGYSGKKVMGVVIKRN
jgi:hypothetical protein